MSQKIDDVLHVLAGIRGGYRTDKPESLRRVRVRVVREIAKQRGVPAGTVRSQLSRAHEQLRAKLDSKHGDRANWLRGLTGLLAMRDTPAAATFGTSSLAWPVAIGAGLAACVTIVLVVSASLDPSSSVEIAAVEPTFAQPVQVADTLRSELV